MLYRIYLYKPVAEINKAPIIDEINEAICSEPDSVRNKNLFEESLMAVDKESISKSIETLLGDKCIINSKGSLSIGNKGTYLYIATSFSKAPEVLPVLHMIASLNKLVLYDREKDRFYYKDVVDDAFVEIKQREQYIKRHIRFELEGFWNIIKVYDYEDKWYQSHESAYVVTIKKIKNISIEQRAEQFYKCLFNALDEGEVIECRDRSFTVKKGHYSITYCLEGYTKCADRLGYMDGGRAKSSLVKRMSCEMAYAWLNYNCSELERRDIYQRMNYEEMRIQYPNPADRFVASVNITKWQRKQKLDIRYSGMGYYSSEILFYVVPSEFYDDIASISFLKIEEESASFILPFLYEVYPYFQDRYYLDDNHVPTQMWRTILRRIEMAKRDILSENDSRIRPYIKRFNLFTLSDDSSEDDAMIRENPLAFLYKHKSEVIDLYNAFVKWSECQLKIYDESRMFNIVGP